jgi:hypothetical protein
MVEEYKRDNKVLLDGMNEILSAYYHKNYMPVIRKCLKVDHFYVYSGQPILLYDNYGSMGRENVPMIYRKGSIIFLPHYISTSFKTDPSSFFWRRSDKIVFKIKINKSSMNWLLIDMFSMFKEEREILLRCHSFLAITNIFTAKFDESLFKFIECTLCDDLNQATKLLDDLGMEKYLLNYSFVEKSEILQSGGGSIKIVPSVMIFPDKQLNDEELSTIYSDTYEKYKTDIDNILNTKIDYSLFKNKIILNPTNIYDDILEISNTPTKGKNTYKSLKKYDVLETEMKMIPVPAMAGGNINTQKMRMVQFNNFNL